MNELLLVIYLFVLITGACIGSFLNVVALRALSKESIVFPASKCPVCNEPIKWYDNIPVLSYLFTFRGKCRNCGCKVSLQYPIVEAITALLFLAVVLSFGIGLQSLMLLILLCISIVIMITDFKEEYVYDSHLWIFIAASIIYAFLFRGGVNNLFNICLSIIFAVIAMELIARLSYYLVRKDSAKEESTPETNEENKAEVETSQNDTLGENPVEEKNDENIDINEYVQKYKRAFGEGDTYLAAGIGALLGIKGFIVAVSLAIIIQAVCLLPQFIRNLYKQGEKRLLFSISAFVVLAILYWVFSNVFNLHLWIAFAIIIPLIYFAFDIISGLKKTVNEQGFVAIPFGPAILISAFIMLFFSPIITLLIKKYILFMM